MARQTLFGVGFHGAFTHLAPANWNTPAIAGGAAAGGAAAGGAAAGGAAAGGAAAGVAADDGAAAGVAAGGDGAARDVAAALDREMDWHAIHAFRVRKSHEYFSRSDNASALILVLKAFFFVFHIVRKLARGTPQSGKYQYRIRAGQSA